MNSARSYGVIFAQDHGGSHGAIYWEWRESSQIIRKEITGNFPVLILSLSQPLSPLSLPLTSRSLSLSPLCELQRVLDIAIEEFVARPSTFQITEEVFGALVEELEGSAIPKCWWWARLSLFRDFGADFMEESAVVRITCMRFRRKCFQSEPSRLTILHASQPHPTQKTMISEMQNPWGSSAFRGSVLTAASGILEDHKEEKLMGSSSSDHSSRRRTSAYLRRFWMREMRPAPTGAPAWAVTMDCRTLSLCKRQEVTAGGHCG